MNKVPIRVKIMLWYALLTTVLVFVFVPVFYGTISVSLYNSQLAQLETSIAQSTAAVNAEEGEPLRWDSEDTVMISAPTAVVDTEGTVIFSNTDMNWVTEQPFLPGEARRLDTEDGHFRVLDGIVQSDGKTCGYIRVGAPMTSVLDSLSDIRFMLYLAIPAYLLAAALGSLFLAKRALKPIANITKTAGAIQSEGLSQRITGVESNDEVGGLARTFNGMLEHLEVVFRREKQFASDASHELRTPVAVVMAYSESLLEHSDGLDIDTLKAAEEIYAESRRMSTIISQLLMLTRGYEGRYPMELEMVNLSEIVESVQEQMEERASAGGITLTTKTANNLILTGDQSLLTQMIINLVENAVKYGKPGGAVTVVAKACATEIVLIVSDNGIGIPSEEQQLVFERFYRTDGARDRSGTGLGLSIVKWIVQEHHGQISLFSAPDEGTTFQVSLPVSPHSNGIK